MPNLLKTMVVRATKLLHADSGFVYLFDRQRGDLELVLEEGFSTRIGSHLKLGDGMAGRVAQARQPMIVDDYRIWEHRSAQYEGSAVSAVVQVPMLSGGDLIGVLGIQEIGTTERRFNDADVRVLSLFAGQAAGAVQSARLLAESQQRTDELVALH
ncbi:MAG TPA: GAF domain-containing protein, partial [Anaerolineae bacterium]